MNANPTPFMQNLVGSRPPHPVGRTTNADMRDYVGRLLAEHYEVTAVADGLAALAIALASPPDLVLSDVMMPGLGRFSGCCASCERRSAHAPFQWSCCPLVQGRSRPSRDFRQVPMIISSKPFSARELLARVRTHLELGRLRRELASELKRQVEERTGGAGAHLPGTRGRSRRAQGGGAKNWARHSEQRWKQERLRALGQMASGNRSRYQQRVVARRTLRRVATGARQDIERGRARKSSRSFSARSRMSGARYHACECSIDRVSLNLHYHLSISTFCCSRLPS